MSEHRLRLTNDDLDLIVSALRARMAMTSGARRHRAERLAERLADIGRGNPKWRLEALSQAHEDPA